MPSSSKGESETSGLSLAEKIRRKEEAERKEMEAAIASPPREGGKASPTLEGSSSSSRQKEGGKGSGSGGSGAPGSGDKESQRSKEERKERKKEEQEEEERERMQ